MIEQTSTAPELTLADADAWRRWLGANFSAQDGVWLVLAKQGTSGPTGLKHPDALAEALCHGWIDGQRRRRDERTFVQRFTPRRARSPWSQRNVQLVEQLTREGRMHEAGDAEVARAKADGRWQAAYAGPRTIEVPDDLREALAAEPDAQAMFELLSSQNRYSILYRLTTAKREATRTARIERYVAMLARGETIYPQKRRREDDM